MPGSNMRIWRRPGLCLGLSQATNRGPAPGFYLRSGALRSGRLHLDGDPRRLLVADREVRRDGTQAFVPDLQLVLARRQIVERELSIRTGDGVEGVRRHDNPRAHPGVELAVDVHDLRLVEGDRDRPALRLRAIEGSIKFWRGMDVVEQAIAIQKVHGAAGRNDHDAGDEHAAVLVNLDLFGLGRRRRVGWRVLEPYHRIPELFLRR